jgi:putative transposase
MMNNIAFEQWALELRLKPNTKDLITRIRTSAPSRRVRSAAGNVSGSFPSRKMGLTIQFESHTLELPYIQILENDPEVLEFYDQPEQIRLTYKHPNGKKVSFYSTPDFFVLRKASAVWIEVKPIDILQEWQKKTPARICQDQNGRWKCPPAIQYASQFEVVKGGRKVRRLGR